MLENHCLQITIFFFCIQEGVSLAKIIYGDLLSLMNKKNYLKELIVVAICRSLEKVSFHTLNL